MASSAQNHVPIIDIAVTRPLNDIASEIRDACRQLGFFQVIIIIVTYINTCINQLNIIILVIIINNIITIVLPLLSINNSSSTNTSSCRDVFT